MSETDGFTVAVHRGSDGVHIRFEDPVGSFDQFLTDEEARELIRLLNKYVEEE